MTSKNYDVKNPGFGIPESQIADPWVNLFVPTDRICFFLGGLKRENSAKGQHGWSTFSDSVTDVDNSDDFTTLFDALLIFENDPRFSEHLSCWSEIFDIHPNIIHRDFKARVLRFFYRCKFYSLYIFLMNYSPRH